jgi:hypothetical protein
MILLSIVTSSHFLMYPKLVDQGTTFILPIYASHLPTSVVEPHHIERWDLDPDQHGSASKVESGNPDPHQFTSNAPI